MAANVQKPQGERLLKKENISCMAASTLQGKVTHSHLLTGVQTEGTLIHFLNFNPHYYTGLTFPIPLKNDVNKSKSTHR